MNNWLSRPVLISLVLVLVLLATSFSVARADPGWYTTGWQYRKEITFNSANVSANQTDFPVLISLTDADLAARAQNDGDDILFTDSGGANKLSHEIERFDGDSGELVAWVKVPSLSSSSNTEIYMYYGNTGAGNSENVTGVWDSNYRMVQHLHETSKTGGAYNDHLDSTSNDNDGEAQNGVSMNGTGKMDGADIFDGGDDYVDPGTPFQATFRGSFSIEAWIKPDDGIPASKNSVVGTTNSDSSDRMNVESPRDTGKIGFFYESNNIQARAMTANAVFSNGAESWHYVVVVADSAASGPGAHKIYFDGVNQALDGTDDGDNSAVTYTDWTSSDNLWVGAYNQYGNGANWFDGLIDEVRMSDTARSASWIQTSYNNQSDPSSFYSVGSEETTVSAVAVGGEIYRINKLKVLAPWLGLMLTLLLIVGGSTLLIRRTLVARADKKRL